MEKIDLETHLPTLTSAEWTVAELRVSLDRELAADAACANFYCFTYAVTEAGWNILRPSILKWLKDREGRSVTLYAGTDHGLTEPGALKAMLDDGVKVRLMKNYQGVFHPKVFWLSGENTHLVWVASNNFTREGLLHNIEFATLIKSTLLNPDLNHWFLEVDKGSEPLDGGLLNSYTKEREDYYTREKDYYVKEGENYKKLRAGLKVFTWSGRTKPRRRSQRTTAVPSAQAKATDAQNGNLIMEITPLETGAGGKQIQIPKEAAISFFATKDQPGNTKQIKLQSFATRDIRDLTITLFGNHTTRLSINELDYSARPCVIVFSVISSGLYEFEIVQQSVFPDRYDALLAQCDKQTRHDSRKWGIVE